MSRPPSARARLRMAWRVVLLLMPVALLNYLDRQMLAAMKYSVMADIPSIGTEANWGFMLGQVKWVYAFLSPIGSYVLIDVSEPAKAAGFRYPVALTHAAWERCVAVPPGVRGQDEAGRLGDLLWQLRLAIAGSDGGPKVRFGVHVRNDNRGGTPPLAKLKALCGPGDQAEPVVTVMLPEED